PARRREAHALSGLRLIRALRRPSGRTLLRLLAALASGALLALAFPPVDAGPLAFVALVPLLWAWRDASPWAAARDGFVFALSFLAILMAGLTHTGYTGTVSLIFAAACYYAATGALTAVFARFGLRNPFLTAAVWVFFEALRDRWPLGGLAWGELGITLHNVAFARALASFGGVYLLSLVIVAVNGLLVDALVAGAARRTRAVVVAAGGLVALLVLSGVADVTRYQPQPTGRLRFALLQGDTIPGADETAAVSSTITDAHFALADRLHGHYDLIVFPESALEFDPEEDPPLRAQIVALAQAHDAVVLVNARYVGTTGRLYNANLAYGPDGRLLAVYAKQHLVPFGEYVPFRQQLSFISDLRQIPYDFTAGDRRVLFSVGGRPVGSVICYESAYAPLVRGFVQDGAQAIVVSTSDRSYGRSGIPATHVATGQLRAAETGRPVLHAAISGETAVIDASGRVLQHTGLFTKAIVTGTITTTTGETPYVRFGEWVLAGSVLTLLLAGGYVAVREVRRARP
ncbi:MAG TPA: apolipoprotein N-acyltransferase, partial [Acidimicrobiia bacterium]|nr:apolipoprotein N-acyltransferase [Acidimicrobiia bacterium]